jgi:hypothetical protein
MKTPEEYRKFAQECRRLAGKADIEAHKAILEEMALVWSQLAVEADEKRPQVDG